MDFSQPPIDTSLRQPAAKGVQLELECTIAAKRQRQGLFCRP